MTDQPNYYAIIPAPVRYAPISANAKLLYGELTALADKLGYAWATNNYFSELYGVNKRSITRWVNELEKGEFIRVEVTRKADGFDRKIYINPIDKNVHTLSTKLSNPIDKNVQPYRQKCLHNNTYNNTVNNIDTPEEESPPVVEEKPKPKAKKKTSIPEGFELTDELTQLAVNYWSQNGRQDINLIQQFTKFKAHHTAKGSRMACWSSAWQTWYCNAIEFTRPNKSQAPATQKAGFIEKHTDKTWRQGL